MRQSDRSWILGALGGFLLYFASLQGATALTDSQKRQSDRFALGNAVWILYHEIGHLLINEFQLPVLGREEDAVDHLATVTLLEGADEQMDGFLTDAVDGFFLSARMKRRKNTARQFFAGHGLDEQRAYEVACLMLGNDKNAFFELAETINLPADQRERCPSAYVLARSSWQAVLEPHTGGWLNRPSKDAVTFAYGNSSPAYARARAILADAQVLEAAADFLGLKYVFPRQIALRAEECGEANAYFRPDDGEVVICYELVEEFRALLADYFKGL
ncbi:hypothetical protein MNBD_ALPHA09-2 [hydrothermal vent metagenome]|uniref:Metallopeptidase n=1 Tax=hydrothermal vent metagenome TaxID=652676 RepID=A0A3B0T4P0_9ZZZZ